MKKLYFLLSVLFFANLNAQVKFDSYEFGALDFENVKIEIPLNAEKIDSDYTATITDKLFLAAQSGKNRLFSSVKNENEYKEFLSFWKPILENNGFKVISTEYKDDFAAISYDSTEGLAIRNFWADEMNYNAKDENEIGKLKDELISALDKNNMKTIAALRINNEIFRPTFALYYITKKNETQEKEIRLRQLKKGEDIDFELLENSVIIVKKDSSFSLVYIGRELGFVSKLARDLDSANDKLANYKKFLIENNKEFVEGKIIKLKEPLTVGENVYNYLLNIYFFQ